MNINKKLPVWALVLLDLVLVAAIIFPFAIFHHVGEMRGWWGDEDPQKQYNENTQSATIGTNDWFLPSPSPEQSADPASAETPTGQDVSPTPGTPTSGETDQPSATTDEPEPEKVEPVVLTGDAGIRAYAEENGLPLPGENCSYVSFYRSENVCVTLYSVTEKGGRSACKYYVYDVYVRDVKNLFTVAGAQKDMHDLIADGEKYSGGTVIAAVNGDYSSNKNHCRVVVRNGILYRNAGYYDSDICVMYHDGVMETYDYKTFDFDAVEQRTPYQIWDFGPALLDADGRAKTKFDETAYDRHIVSGDHPRTAIGYYEPGHYCFVVVDGRQTDDDGKTNLVGMTVAELAALMEKLGCRSAYNLDGGDSSQAYMNGADIRIDKTRAKQRVLSDIICVGEIGTKEE